MRTTQAADIEVGDFFRRDSSHSRWFGPVERIEELTVDRRLKTGATYNLLRPDDDVQISSDPSELPSYVTLPR